MSNQNFYISMAVMNFSVIYSANRYQLINLTILLKTYGNYTSK